MRSLVGPKRSYAWGGKAAAKHGPNVRQQMCMADTSIRNEQDEKVRRAALLCVCQRANAHPTQRWVAYSGGIML